MRIQSLIELLYKKALVAAKAWASLYLNWFKRELFGGDIIHTSCLNGIKTVSHRFAIITNHFDPLSKALANRRCCGI